MRYKTSSAFTRVPDRERRQSRPQPRPSGPPSPVRNWIATLIMLLAVPVLAIPAIGSGASAALTATPSAAPAGSSVLIHGTRFPAGDRVELAVAGNVAQSRLITVSAQGTFSAELMIPTATEPGTYRVEVRPAGSLSIGRVVLARLSLTVIEAIDSGPEAKVAPVRDVQQERRRVSATARSTATTAPSPQELIPAPSLPPATPEPTPAPATPAPAPATPAPTVAPPPPAPAPPPPASPPPSISGRAFYIAPGGNDSAAGSISAPWRTVARASQALAAGDVLYARGGVYTGQGGYNWATSASGTSGAPITFAAYPGESPVFDGGWTIGNGLILADVRYVTVRGLKFIHHDDQWGGAAILLLRAQNIVIEGSVFIDNGGTAQQDHHIYVNSGCANIVIRGNYMQGTPGAAVHIYHDPGPTNVVIAGNTMKNGFWGVVIGSLSNNIAMTGNSFSGNVVNMDLTTNSSNVTATGNSPNNIIN